jgi:hypothetical protein
MVWVDGAQPKNADSAAENQPNIKARMFVPAANTNNLYVLGATETGDLTKLDTVNLALTPLQPLGTTPSAVALSADKKSVYVVCSGVNGVAVIDITGEGNLIRGFIPTGAYPTAVTGLPDGRIAILNGHGNSVQLVDAPDDAKLDTDTAEVMAKLAYRDEMLDTARPAGPIRHVVYVVRGNDLGESTAGIENDYQTRLGYRFTTENTPPDPADVPPTGYLWNAATQAGLKLRNYGFEVHNLAQPNADGEQVDRIYDPVLSGSTDMEYRGPDSAYPDTDRAKEFAAEMAEYGQVGNMPPLLLVRIGADEQALKIIEDAVSKSKFAGETAVISPGATYNGLSALHTAEIILGLHPMTIFDSAAKPMLDAFANTPTPAK